MSVDEPVRLRLRQRLAELLDAELADAMMESMPPMRWDQLATKDDIQRLERVLVVHGERFDQLAEHGDRLESLIAAQGQGLEALGERVDALGQRLENRIDTLGERVDTLAGHVENRTNTLGERVDTLAGHVENRTDTFGERLDALGERLDAQLHGFSGEMALLEGRLSARYAETTRMLVFAMMTLFVGVVAVMATTLA